MQTITPTIDTNLRHIQKQDDKINLLRDDVASLRDLLERANYTGVSDRVLNEIATLSGRIESLSDAVTQTRQDPHLMDAIRDIHSLLDRPAQDPALNAHFDRILSKLDSIPVNDHFEEFERLSGQLDQLRELLSASPRVQHITDMSGQMGMIVNRLGQLEETLRAHSSAAPVDTLSQQLGNRLSGLQEQIERLDPSDRLMRLEDQFAAFADRLETNQDFAGVSKPIETLARQMESLVDLIDKQDQGAQRSALDHLAQRIVDLDERVQANIGMGSNEQRFDHVERTLARIDDLLAQRMESTDLSSLETGLSRLADRMEAQEAALKASPAHAGQLDMASLSRLEGMIADLADRLDDASQTQGSGDQHFFETLTSRLDSLAEQFEQSQSRFDAVDRIGHDIQQLASATPKAPMNEAKMAEAAAVKALRKVGPLAAAPMDNNLEIIMDGLKDDLSGLRQLAETNETSTKESLTSVSGMLKGIADRLGTLEDEVRAKEIHQELPAAQLEPVAETVEEDAPRGLGRLLRRGKKKAAAPDATKDSKTTTAPTDQAQHLSAAELLASRTNRNGRGGAAPTVQANAPVADARGAGSGDRQPRISISGRAVSASAAPDMQPQARVSGQSTQQAAQQMAQQPITHGNAALKTEAAPQPNPAAEPQRRMAQIVDSTSEGPTRAPSAGGASKADFIAAARRAAQAAAQESERVEKEDSEKRSFLSRFKGSKKAKAEAKPADTETTSAADLLAARAPSEGKNRKERRAAVAEAARKAKQVKDLDAAELAQHITDGENAELVSDLLEDEQTRKSLFAKIGSALSRHSRPLLMAAAAILLAITTLQLVQNPNSSLHGLFNKGGAETEVAPSVGEADPVQIAPEATDGTTKPDQQSSLAPPSGNLMPQMQGEDASRAITFAQPSGAQKTLAGPRLPQEPKAPTDESIATFTPEQTSPTPGITPGAGQGVDLTPTSAIPTNPDAYLNAIQTSATPQAMPPKPSDAPMATTSSSPLAPSVQAAIEMNKILAPGVSDTPLMSAAKNGDALAQYELGRRLTLGQGMTADLNEAAEWFEKAAAQSMPQAQYSLANLYEKGKGVKQDYQVARLWYQRAADAGNVKAMHNLAVLFAEGGLGKPDFKQASKWFIKAADHGLKDSQYNLAILYARGMGVKQDLLQSYKWFAIAAKNGDKGAGSKRDEVFGVLNAAQKKTAMALVEAWVPKVGKPSANKLANIPDAWKHIAPQVVRGIPTAPQGFAVNQETIAKTQSMLGALGYNAGPADGQMGPRTRTAIRNFQEVAGMPVTGKIDKALLEALSMRVI